MLQRLDQYSWSRSPRNFLRWNRKKEKKIKYEQSISRTIAGRITHGILNSRKEVCAMGSIWKEMTKKFPRFNENLFPGSSINPEQKKHVKTTPMHIIIKFLEILKAARGKNLLCTETQRWNRSRRSIGSYAIQKAMEKRLSNFERKNKLHLRFCSQHRVLPKKRQTNKQKFLFQTSESWKNLSAADLHSRECKGRSPVTREMTPTVTWVQKRSAQKCRCVLKTFVLPF